MQPIETLFDAKHGQLLPLPAELVDLYGDLYMPRHDDRPHVISDYVSTMDGVVALKPLGPPARRKPGEKSPGAIIGASEDHDLMIMALLHAVADVLVIGDVGLAGNPGDVRTAQGIYPALGDAFGEARAQLGKPPTLPIAVISPQVEVDFGLPIFRRPEARVMIVTSESTASAVGPADVPDGTEIVGLPTDAAGIFSARSVLDAITQRYPADLILSDASPRFTTRLIAENCLDEFFLTVSPQIAGRTSANPRPGFAAGELFIPANERWAELISVKRANSYLFLRYDLSPPHRLS